jgi:formylglycine-generating enzyme required for sulfatase activity
LESKVSVLVKELCLGILACSLILSLTSAGCHSESERWTEPLTEMTFVRIPAGDFEMGSPAGEPQRSPDEKLHKVRISRSFYLAQKEVTQAQWQKVMGTNPSWFQSCGAKCPVEKVNWYEAKEFIRRLNQRSNMGFRLPTESEWEYACRAGTRTAFSTGENLTADQANYDGSYPYAKFAKGKNRGTTTPVGSFSPNAWGIFDLHGNVWEWTSDLYCPYPDDEVTDPHPNCDSEMRVIRGGSWYFGADSARSALRYTHRPQDSGFSIGFRLAADRSP